MREPEETVEMSMSLTESIRNLFSKRYERGIWRTKPKLHLAMLVGRPVTTDTQGFDQTTCTGGMRDWPGGTTVAVDGQFTCNNAGTGSVFFTPAAGDEYVVMYARVTIGAKAGAGAVNAAIDDAAANQLVKYHTFNAAATNFFSFPSAAQGAGNDNCIIPYAFFGHIISGTDRLRINLGVMILNETFIVRLRLRSREGLQPTVGTTNGAWAVI